MARAPRVSAGPPEPFVAPMKRRLSLFTGCGALDYALPWCSPVAYCERDPDAAAVLRARMLDGCLTSSYHPGSTPFAPPFAQGIIRRICGSPISLHWAAQRVAVQCGAALHQRVDDIVVSVQAEMPSSQHVGQRGHPAAGKHSGSDIVFACVKQKDMA